MATIKKDKWETIDDAILRFSRAVNREGILRESHLKMCFHSKHDIKARKERMRKLKQLKKAPRR